MHQKKSEYHIWKEPLTIEIPQHTPHYNPPQEIEYTNEHNFNNPSSKIKKPLITTPHQRPSYLMSQTPSNISHSPPTLSSLQHHHFPNTIISPKSTSLFSSCCSFSFLEPLLASKTVALTTSFLLFLPSLYFFSSNQIVSIIVFSVVVVVVITLNLSAPRFPSIRLFLARSFPIKFSSLPSTTPPKLNPPVIWSIGSKPNLEKRPSTGSWVQIHKNGDVYEGEFYRGKCSGSGVYYYYMSGRYEGDWIDEKYDGHGVETWAKGSRYRGQYRQGLRHGFGVYRFYTGDVYAGEWCNGQSHGCGAHTCEDGSRYVGEFKWGVKHGLGSYHFRNGDVYAGEYFADKMHGFGVYSFAHGHRYEGAWHEGRRQGLGLYTFRNGETQSGHWENGVLNVSSTSGSPPGSPFAVSVSRVLNAVQEARLAAERAATASKVEDKVNKAVAAANRAATAARVAAVRAVQNQIHQQNCDENIPLSIIRENGDSRRQKYAV